MNVFKWFWPIRHWGPILLIHCNVWDEITYPFLILDGATVEIIMDPFHQAFMNS